MLKLNIIAMFIVTMLTKVSAEEIDARQEMFVLPDSEKNAGRAIGVIKSTKKSMLTGVAITAILLVLWIIPYLANKI